MGGYAKLKVMGIDMTQRQARDLIRTAGAQMIEHDRNPTETRTCSTAFHGTMRKKSRPPAWFEVRGFDSHGPRFVCRYCVYLIAHAIDTKDVALLSQTLDEAQDGIELPPERVDD